MKFKNIASTVKKALPKQEKMYNLVKTTDEMIKNAGDNTTDLKTQITNFQKAPNTNFMSSLNKRVPPSKSFQIQKGKDYGLNKDLLHGGQFHLENGGKTSKILNERVLNKSSFKQSAGVPSLNKYFDKLAPKKMDYRYVDPQTYEYKLQGLTQEKLIRNKMREDGEAANNNKDINDLDATTKFRKWREQDLTQTKASKIQALGRGYLDRQNLKEGLKIATSDEAPEIIPEGKRISGVDAIKLGKAKRNNETTVYTATRKQKEQEAKDREELYDELMEDEAKRNRKQKENEQLKQNKAHTFTPKQRSISKIYARDTAQGIENADLAKSDAAKYYEKSASTIQKALRKHRPTAEQQYLAEQKRYDEREERRQRDNERAEKKFRALPEKEQERLREEYAFQQRKQDEKQRKQYEKERKQFLLDTENKRREKEIQRESNIRSSGKKKEVEQKLKSSKFEGIHNQLKKNHEEKNNKRLQQGFNALNAYAEANKASKARRARNEGVEESKDLLEEEEEEAPEQIPLASTQSIKTRTDRKKTEKEIERLKAFQTNQDKKKIKKLEKAVDFVDNDTKKNKKNDDDDDDDETLFTPSKEKEYNFTEADKKYVISKQNEVQKQIFETENKLRSLNEAMKILEKSNLTESSAKISKELKDSIVRQMKSVDPSFQIHGLTGIKAVYERLQRNHNIAERSIKELEYAKERIPDKYKKAKDKKNQSMSVANRDGFSPTKIPHMTTRSTTAVSLFPDDDDDDKPVRTVGGGGGRIRKSKEEDLS